MNKIYLLLLCCMVLGCEKRTTELVDRFIMPKDLEDCKVYQLEDGNGINIFVVRCPETTTTQSGGKHKRTISITNSKVEYYE